MAFTLSTFGQTGTTTAGKFKMTIPDAATATDSVCTWDGYSKLLRYIPKSKVIDVFEYANLAGFPSTGVKSKIYTAKDTNKIYRWTGSGSAYVELSAGGGSTPSLDAVTDVGSNTPNHIIVGDLVASEYEDAFLQGVKIGHNGVTVKTESFVGAGAATIKTTYVSADRVLEIPDEDGFLATAVNVSTAQANAESYADGLIAALDIPATISDLTAGATYTSGLAKTTDATGSILIGDWNGDVNGTTLEVNDTSKTIGIVGQINQHYGNYADDTVDSSSFAIGPYTMTYTGKSGTSVDNFGTSTLLASPEEGNMIKKTAANGDYTQIIQDIDAHATSIQTYDESTNTASTLGVIPNDIAFTVQNDTDAYGLDMNTTGFSIIDEFRPNEYALHLETGGSELNAGQLANNTLTLGAYDVNGTSMTPFIELKSNNIPTMTLPQLAGSGTRMVTVTSTGEVGVAAIPSGGGSITLTTTGSSGASTLVGSTLNVPNYTLSGLGGVSANSSITGATKTKITYDAKGLVTAGADATTADIADSTDKRYVTDAQLAKLNELTASMLPYKYTTPVNVTGTLSETQVLQISIPANTFDSSDILSITMLFSKTGTAGNCTWKMKLSTSATMPSGTTSQIGTGAFNSSGGYAGYEREMFTINAGNIYGFPFTTTTGNSDMLSSSSAISSQAFDNTVQNYLYISLTNGSSADTTTLRGVKIANN